MSSNLLKLSNCDVQQEKARVIDTNALAEQRIEALSLKMRQSGAMPEDVFSDISEDSALAEDEENAFESLQSNVINIADTQELERKALEEANALLADAQSKADSIKEEAAREREQVLEEAKRQGYEEGCARARQELEREKAGLQAEKKQLEAEYDTLVTQLESELITHLTDIYEHVFQVDLSVHREILEYLITTAMSRTEGSRNFLLHISKEDYSYVSMRKQQLQSTVGENASMEIIEDMTLSRNECMIETENGIIDCGLGTQLAELSRKLRLLSYQSR